MNQDQLRAALSHTGGKSPRVYVYCREESHADREWDAGRFLYNGKTWVAERTLCANGRRLHRPEDNAVDLAGNRHLSQGFTAPDGALKGVEIRQHYHLHCDKCDLGRRTTGAKLHPILDMLAAGGVSEVSLKWLAARV